LLSKKKSKSAKAKRKKIGKFLEFADLSILELK